MSGTPVTWTVRSAGADDADRLARFGAAIFTATFGHNYPAPDLAGFLARAYAPAKVAAEIARTECRMDVVTGPGGAVLGYAFSGPLELPVADPEPGAWEMKRIYLDPVLQGRGVAAVLMDRCRAAAGAAGAPALYLGVWSQNPRALAFYRRLGFRDAGRYVFHVGTVEDDEIILRLALDPAPPPAGG